jgi:hypothetical protein
MKKFIKSHKELTYIGLETMTRAMDAILDHAISENGGVMNRDEICDLCDLLDDEWPDMGRYLSGYMFGACTDSAEELSGERLAKQRELVNYNVY